MPRGRPKGSKNKVSRESRQTGYSIGIGKQFSFPIVRDGNVRGKVALLSVGAESFVEALKAAVHWALAYSESHGATFWPLVKVASKLVPENRFIKRVSNTTAWAESNDYGAWYSTNVLEVI